MILFLLSLLVSFVGPGWGQVVVLVNAKNPIDDISTKKLLNIYTGRLGLWDQNDKIFPATMKFDNPATPIFFKKGLDRKKTRSRRCGSKWPCPVLPSLLKF
jgi:hypothetical protein